jgi:V/A-type H+-transporting ATPase subunit E
MQESIRQAEVERNRQTYLTSEEVKSSISTVREKLLDEAFLAAEKKLQDVRDSPDYQELYKKLLLEALGEIRGKDPVLHIDNRDRDLCQSVIYDLTISAIIVPDLESAGGLVVSSSDGLITVHNTVESRLEKARDVYRLDIMRELTGG